jgi:FKBP12-rapamycin complex-associated protein
VIQRYGLDVAPPTIADPSVNTSFSVKKLPVNQFHLQKSWSVSHRSLAKDDWFEWIRRLGVELLKESPSHALRACGGLAGVYYPLAKELLNAAFLSCWNEMHEQYQVYISISTIG